MTTATSSAESGRRGRLLRVVCHERLATLTASPSCWHAGPVGVSTVLTLAPGFSPWRLQWAHSSTQAPVTDRGGGAGTPFARSGDRRVLAVGRDGRLGARTKVLPRGRAGSMSALKLTGLLLVDRSCRIECVVGTHAYASTRMLTRGPARSSRSFPGITAGTLSLILGRIPSHACPQVLGS